MRAQRCRVHDWTGVRARMRARVGAGQLLMAACADGQHAGEGKRVAHQPGGGTILVVHCAMWFAVVSSWNGMWNIGPDGSMPISARSAKNGATR